MIDGKYVTAWIPYGRANTVSILVEYLQRDHDQGVVDELWLCLNTDPDQTDDLAWAFQVAKERPWIKLKHRPPGVVHHGRKQRNTGYFYRHMVDPDTIYVRFDDDVVYVHQDTVERLALAAVHGDQPCAFPIIINNAICSHFLQRDGKIPVEWGEVELYCMDASGWADGQFAVDLHELFLNHVDNGTVESLFGHTDWQLPMGEQFSVSCFASRGSMYAALDPPGVLGPDHIMEEESWHTETAPRKYGVRNKIISNAVVSHWSFFTQHAFLSEREDLLEEYRALAKGLNG